MKKIRINFCVGLQAFLRRNIFCGKKNDQSICNLFLNFILIGFGNIYTLFGYKIICGNFNYSCENVLHMLISLMSIK
jgi:hypothetical protein